MTELSLLPLSQHPSIVMGRGCLESVSMAGPMCGVSDTSPQGSCGDVALGLPGEKLPGLQGYQHCYHVHEQKVRKLSEAICSPARCLPLLLRHGEGLCPLAGAPAQNSDKHSTLPSAFPSICTDFISTITTAPND